MKARNKTRGSGVARRTNLVRAKYYKASRTTYHRLKGPGTETQKVNKKIYATLGEGTEHFERAKTRWKTERGGNSTEHVLARCGSLKQ